MNRRKLNIRPMNTDNEDLIPVCHDIIHSDPENLTIIEALDTIHSASIQSKLSNKLWEECKIEFDFLRSHTGLNNKQLVVLACLCEAGDGLSWRGIGRHLGLSRLKTMALSPDIEEMKEKRWIVPHVCHERGGGFFEGFKQVPGIITAFRENRNFVPEVLDGMSEQAFVDRLLKYVAKECADQSIPISANNWWLIHFAQCNPELPLCKTVLDLKDDLSKIILLRMVADYACYAGEHNEGLRMSDIDELFEDDWELNVCLRSLKEDSHELICRGLIEHACVDGMADQDLFRLSRLAKETLLSEFVQVTKPPRRMGAASRRDLIRADSIKFKQLYYDQVVDRQINRVASLLSLDGLSNVQKRLESIGHRKGICCLFYGAPGTGKTECVLQLARQTGRDVMQVNIAGIRDKYVGETEKNIKGIFVRYKDLCKYSKVMPILLFNEADALINSRFETTESSVEKMDNAMQNIILQEIENLEGILIATTNLTGTLDKAFDRRFLFKVEFNKPSAETKADIWLDKLSYLNKKHALQLAHDFDFSGGQIENVARKCEIEYVLSGSQPSMQEITEFCREETLNRSNRVKIGF